jgi:hypothetical protein
MEIPFYEMIPSIIALIFVVGIIFTARCFVSPINEGKRLIGGMQESLIASENFQSLKKYGSSSAD